MAEEIYISARYIVIVFLLYLCGAMVFPKDVLAVDCATGKTDTTLSQSCAFANTVDGVDGGNITINTGVTLTISNNQTIVRNTGKQIILNGGSIVMIGTGQIKQTNLWCTDSDSDGYCSDTTSFIAQDASPGPGARTIRNMSNLAVVDCSDSNANLNVSCSWTERKYIQIVNGTYRENYDVLITLDTASLISGGTMQSDCDDMRFYDDESETTSYSYWIESGCNTTTTQIWIRPTKILVGTNYIVMKYNEPTAVSAALAWSGVNTIIPKKTSCVLPGTRFTSLDSAFPRGSSTYGGTGTGGHTHTLSGTTSTKSVDNAGAEGSNYTISVTNGHSHTYSATTASGTHTPAYVDTIFCSYPSIPNQLDTNDLTLFNTLPSGWTRNTSYDNRFPRGAVSYGTTGGGSHTHTYSTTSSTYSWVGVTFAYNAPNPHVWLSGGHNHGISSTTGASTDTPLYRTQVIASPNASAIMPEGGIVMMNSATIPPLGWTRFSSLDTRFPMGAASSGTTGGATTHSHSFSFTSGAPSVQQSGVDSSGSNDYTSSGHTHTGSGTTNAPTALPPYLDMIYVQKNSPSADVTVTVLDALP